MCLCVSCPVLLDLENDHVSRLCSSIALFCSHVDTPPTTITNKNFLLQVINRKNLNCLVDQDRHLIRLVGGSGSTFSLKTSERKAEKIPRINSLFSKFLVRLLRNRRGKSAKNREREKEKKNDGRFYSEKTEF